MAKSNYGRHLPAFLLLFLASEPMHGSMLQNKMESTVPYNKSDAPAIYRALAELEREGCVIAMWDMPSSGAAKKIYTITDCGIERLKILKKDIEERLINFQYFLNECEKINNKKKEC